LKRRIGVGTALFGCIRKSSPTCRASNSVGSEGYLKPKDRLRWIWRLILQDDETIQSKEAKLTTWTFGAQVPHKIMVARFQFKHHVAQLLLLDCLHTLHLLVLDMVGCLCHDLTHEQPPWFDKCVKSYTKLLFMVHGLHEICVLFVYHEHNV